MIIRTCLLPHLVEMPVSYTHLVGGKVAGKNVHIVATSYRPFLFLNLHSVKVGDLALDRLNGIALVDVYKRQPLRWRSFPAVAWGTAWKIHCPGLVARRPVPAVRPAAVAAGPAAVAEAGQGGRQWW